MDKDPQRYTMPVTYNQLCVQMLVNVKLANPNQVRNQLQI